MKKFINVIESCDSFGVHLLLSMQSNSPKFKTIYGGVLTLAIYSIASVYFIYLMFIWQTKLIPPTVTSQTRKKEEGLNLVMNQPIFHMSVVIDNPTDELREIESRTKLYDVAGVYYGKNYMVKEMPTNKPGQNCSMDKLQVDFFDPICQNLQDDHQTWLYNSQARADDVFWEYDVNFCNSTDPTCISVAERQKMMDAVAYWQLTTIIEDIDLETGEIYGIPADYSFNFDPQFKKGFQIQLKITKAEIRIDDGFLFPNYQYLDIVKDVKMMISYQEQPQTGPVIVVSLEKYYYKIEIQYSKFGDVLASFSSLLQGLLLCGIIMTSFNNNSLKRQSVDFLMSMYFPQLKNYRLKTNWKGQITQILNNGVQVDQQFEDNLLKTIYSLRQKMSLKFNYLNLLHEVNKLQLAIQSFQSKQHIKQLQTANYVLSFITNPISNIDSPISSSKDQEPLSEEHFLQFLSTIDKDSKVGIWREQAMQDMGLIKQLTDQQVPYDNIPYTTSPNKSPAKNVEDEAYLVLTNRRNILSIIKPSSITPIQE